MFMRAAGVPFEYEIEGFDLGAGLCYIPDFYLPFQDAFMEVKSPTAGLIDWAKINALSLATKKVVFVFTQNPSMPLWKSFGTTESSAKAIREWGEDEHYIWCECPHCGKVGICFDGRADRLPCNCPKSVHGDKGHNFETKKLELAYSESARRFDKYE